MPAADEHSEWLTRKRRIDPKLDARGWRKRSAAGNGAYRLEEYETGFCETRRLGRGEPGF